MNDLVGGAPGSARRQLVDRLSARSWITRPEVAAAFTAVPRHLIAPAGTTVEAANADDTWSPNTASTARRPARSQHSPDGVLVVPFGAHGFGPAAITLTDDVIDLVTAWDQRQRAGDGLLITVHPADTRLPPTGRLRLLVPRRHTQTAITWPGGGR